MYLTHTFTKRYSPLCFTFLTNYDVINRKLQCYLTYSIVRKQENWERNSTMETAILWHFKLWKNNWFWIWNFAKNIFAKNLWSLVLFFDENVITVWVGTKLVFEIGFFHEIFFEYSNSTILGRAEIKWPVFYRAW